MDDDREINHHGLTVKGGLGFLAKYLCNQNDLFQVGDLQDSKVSVQVDFILAEINAYEC